MTTPEALARQKIDELLRAAGWVLQNRDQINLGAGRGVAVREYPTAAGPADYLLFVDRRPVGVVEAKAAGTPLSGVSEQSGKYLVGAANLPNVDEPLRFAYESTGIETFFRDEADPEPRSRRVFAFHKPETLAEWVRETQTLRARLRAMPAEYPLITTGLWEPQVEAITNLERSFALDKPRALIQMATGSGKTFTAVNSVYRLIKFARARRILFLVDRNNLGRQALREFQAFVTPDDGRKFTELYNAQRLTTNVIDPVNKVVITTIQRLYSMLCGEAEYDPENEERSLYEVAGEMERQPAKVVRYNPNIPVEFFDFIITDECHRSIYNLWRQVLEYFDAHLIGLTATPSKQTFGFFHQNLVMEYSRRRAVADGINVDGQVYQIRTEITQRGSRVEAGYWLAHRDKLTRQQRWEQLEDDLEYSPAQLDREVVSESQIRTVIRAFRDKLFTEIFPGREDVPKTLIFAKDDSHAEEIVRIAREEFGKGNEFCQKITYRTSGIDPEDLIASFRNSYNPRIAVTVDMIATGTDVKPIEILLFMRLVKSRNYFEQMLGRGTRVISRTDLEAVTPGGYTKDRFVIIDTVGVVEQEKVDTQTLERKRSVPFDRLLEQVALGAHEEDTLSTLAGRLSRLEKKLSDEDREQVRQALGPELALGPSPLRELAHTILDALDPDKQIEVAQDETGLEEPPVEAVEAAAQLLLVQAVAPFDRPELRNALIAIQQRREQIIDTVSVDRMREAGYSAYATDAARSTVESFKLFIAEHKDEITALQIIFSQPYGQRRLTYAQVKELARAIELPPNSWTTEKLWLAYSQLEKDKVRGVGGKRVLTDVVSLVRHAVELEDELVPYPERVRQRYEAWLAAQEDDGRKFTQEQHWWLDRIAEHIGVNLSIRLEDFNYGEFHNKGGQIAAKRLFGTELYSMLDELNNELPS
jgi:type I restriction enzyme R subunit